MFFEDPYVYVAFWGPTNLSAEAGEVEEVRDKQTEIQICVLYICIYICYVSMYTICVHKTHTYVHLERERERERHRVGQGGRRRSSSGHTAHNAKEVKSKEAEARVEYSCQRSQHGD